MSSSTVSKKGKSGRTPEQQAARDARKAAKLAAATNSAEPSSGDTAKPELEVTEPPHAESSKAAQRQSTELEADSTTKKRRRGSDVDEEGFLEVDLTLPTPLSKAEARAAKKKAKRGGGDGAADGHQEGETGEKAQKKADEKREKPAERKNSIWIGNLAYKTTPDRLKEWLEKGVVDLGGDADCVTRVNLPKEKVKGKGEFANNKGFAYVDFTTPETQALAVQLSEKLLEGRKLLIKLGTDHTPKADAITPKPVKLKGVGVQPHGESATLFVGNLPFDTTEEGLRDLIEGNAAARSAKKEGEKESARPEGEDEPAHEDAEKKVVSDRGGKNSGLRKVRLGAFEDTGRCKGFAFLDFYSPAEATISLANRKNHYYGSRKLTLQYASEEATKRSGGRRNQNLDDKDRKPRMDARGPKSRPSGAGAGAGKREAEDEQVEGDTREEEPIMAKLSVPAYEEDEGRSERRAAKKANNTDVRGKKWEAAGRPRPGAALAMAKREKVAIVEGQGNKIVFD